MIDHSLLHPTLTDAEFEAGCALAARYRVASVCIKPYAVRRAVELLAGSPVKVGCVIGFPSGNSTTEVKRYETELACRDGAVEIDMVINIGKALSGDWEYVEQDVRAVCDEAHRHAAKVKVIFENDSDKYFMPASNMKNFTVATAMEKLGADFKFVTSVYANSLPDMIGTIKGDLRIYGRGDVPISTAFNNGDYYKGIDHPVHVLPALGGRKVPPLRFHSALPAALPLTLARP